MPKTTVSPRKNLPEAVEPTCAVPRDLIGQKALVTGASSGIGQAIAIALGQAGADVMINFWGDDEGAEVTARDVRSHGAKACIHQADVSKEEDVLELFRCTMSELGGIDILVNNAGVQRDAALEEMTLKEWNQVIGVNLTGQFLCAREAVRAFKRRGVVPHVSAAAGKIIFISSVHEFIPWAGHVNYAASKGGVMLMMKSIAQEVAGHRIRVNGIAPGAIQTPINRPAWETQAARDELLELIPYNRIGQPVDIARAAVWLASDQSDYVVGTTLVVDGGMALYPSFAEGG